MPINSIMRGRQWLNSALRHELIAALLLGTLLNGVTGQAQGAAWKFFYLYYDESNEAGQGYQLSSLDTARLSADPQPVYRFPPEGIAPIWDEPPPAILSPDGQSLAMIQWGSKLDSLILINVATGISSALPGISITGELNTTLLGWLPGSQQLLLYKNDGDVIRYDIASKSSSLLFTLKDVTQYNAEVTLSPDGSQLVYCTTQTDNGCGGYALRRLDGSPARAVTFPVDVGCPGYPAIKWSPDGQRIALGCANLTQPDAPSVIIINVPQASTTAYPVSSQVNDLLWMPDSTRLLLDLCASQDVSANDADCGTLPYLNAGTGVLTAGPAAARMPARRLIALGDTLLIDEASSDTQSAALSFYDLDSGKLLRQLTHTTAEYQDASYTIMGIAAPPLLGH